MRLLNMLFIALMYKNEGRNGSMVNYFFRYGSLPVLFAVGIFGYFFATAYPENKRAYLNISVDQFIKMMGQKDFVLINVHIPYQGEIPKTDQLIPFNSIDQYLSELLKAKNYKIVVYCMTGPMGYIAAEKLVDMGYTNVIHFKGGMRAWVNSSRQLQFRK